MISRIGDLTRRALQFSLWNKLLHRGVSHCKTPTEDLKKARQNPERRILEKAREAAYVALHIIEVHNQPLEAV